MKDYFLLAFNNLKRRKLRSWLTMIGIFIGIAAVVALISLGQGLQGFINSQFEQIGGDKILIQSGSHAAESDSSLLLTEKDLNIVRNVKGVEAAEGYVYRNAAVGYKEEQIVTIVSGIGQGYLDLFGDIDALRIIEGRQLKKGDKYKVVVGYSHIFGDVWEKPLSIGSKIIIKDQEFEVIGVLKKQGNPYDDSAVIMDEEVMKDLFEIGEEETMLVAKTKEGFDPEDVSEEIKRKLRSFRGEEEGEETFSVQTTAQLIETFSNIFAVVQAVLVGIAAISLFVGGIGIMNTMYTSVIERTKEIGTLKAVGAKNSDVLILFLFESGLLGIIGGVIGILVGAGIAKGVEYIASTQLGNSFLQASINPGLVLGALAFSFLVGSLSGILPAMQASKLKPAQALRYE